MILVLRKKKKREAGDDDSTLTMINDPGKARSQAFIACLKSWVGEIPH